MRRFALLVPALLLLLPTLARAQAPSPPPGSPQQAPQTAQAPPPPAPAAKKWFFGGGIGASFGDVDYIEIAPLIGYRVHPRISTGLGLFWRSRDDNRSSPSVETNDYGGNLFVQGVVAGPVFVHAEYEYANYEYPISGGGKAEDSISSFLVGAGISQPLGGNVAFYASALYNFSYDDNDPYGPYDSPWVYRAGVSVGF